MKQQRKTTTRQHRPQGDLHTIQTINKRLKEQSIPFDFEKLIERFKDDLIHNRKSVRAYIQTLKPQFNSFEQYIERSRLQNQSLYIAELITDRDLDKVNLGLMFYSDLKHDYEKSCELNSVRAIEWKEQLNHLIRFYSSSPFAPIPDLAIKRFDPYWTEWQV